MVLLFSVYTEHSMGPDSHMKSPCKLSNRLAVGMWSELRVAKQELAAQRQLKRLYVCVCVFFFLSEGNELDFFALI